MTSGKWSRINGGAQIAKLLLTALCRSSNAWQINLCLEKNQLLCTFACRE